MKPSKLAIFIVALMVVCSSFSSSIVSAMARLPESNLSDKESFYFTFDDLVDRIEQAAERLNTELRDDPNMGSVLFELLGVEDEDGLSTYLEVTLNGRIVHENDKSLYYLGKNSPLILKYDNKKYVTASNLNFMISGLIDLDKSLIDMFMYTSVTLLAIDNSLGIEECFKIINDFTTEGKTIGHLDKPAFVAL